MAATLPPMDASLNGFRERAETAGIFCDFDGTLSEIVHVPSAARPVEGAKEVLASLARKYRLTAVVSGRSAYELVEWLGPEVEIWGVHGAERAVGGRVELIEPAASFAPLMKKVLEEAVMRTEQLQIPGLVVEDKTVMVGLHFRAAPDVERARLLLDGIASDLASKYDLVRAGGRLAFELRPPVHLSKEDVVLRRARDAGLSAAMFLGDDRVDLPGFDALDELASEGLVTVRVAVASDEAPAELIARADRVVASPAATVGFLQELL